jgi:glutamate racemase
VQLHALATPLLAPMIEEGFLDNSVSDEIINTYLSNPMLEGISALVLACTHYPLIKDQITRFYSGRVNVLDASEAVAAHTQSYLAAHGLLAPASERAPAHHFYVSDFHPSFRRKHAHLLWARSAPRTLPAVGVDGVSPGQ